MANTVDRDELVRLALEELVPTASGQSPEAEDLETVDGYVDGLLEELAARSIIAIANDDAIPLAVSQPLSELLANAACGRFGKPKMAEQNRRLIEQRIRAMTAAHATDEPVRSVYY